MHFADMREGDLNAGELPKIEDRSFRILSNNSANYPKNELSQTQAHSYLVFVYPYPNVQKFYMR